MFRFTIRELVLLTVIVAMGAGWWMDRARRGVQPPPPAREEGYEVILSGKDRDTPYLFNPRTGQMWQRYSDGEWMNFSRFPDSPTP